MILSFCCSGTCYYSGFKWPDQLTTHFKTSLAQCFYPMKIHLHFVKKPDGCGQGNKVKHEAVMGFPGAFLWPQRESANGWND
ncbi:hypothetical protein X474_02745 [Dethiosulfatarculus sandiegensis]|uniref:Uncharacterized protein n=1 Tax=Dethiosulfatarculus sandiegensis TaxID=1429043 RepID=A0A0D2GLZ1_9BACT|nr:hypothetical protein X474_02745 [Dethiosulfatarculus sandiegensis]